jgi:hypothetical protein
MRIVTVTRHLSIYEGENRPPEIDFNNMQDIDVPEVFNTENEQVVLKRTLLNYVSTITFNKLLASPNEQVGNYILCLDDNRYTLVMILQLEIAGVTQDFGLHLADVFLNV